MDCRNCKENYLYEIYRRCMNDYEKASEALYNFDKICLKSGDTRGPLTIIQSMYECNCKECRERKHLYERFIE